MTGFTEVGYDRRGPAAWITLNRPAKRNALSPVMLAATLSQRSPA